MQKERGHEAKRPGPNSDNERKREQDQVSNKAEKGRSKSAIDTTIVASANTNRQTVLERTAHVALIHEHCLTPAQIKILNREAKQVGNGFEEDHLIRSMGEYQRE